MLVVLDCQSDHLDARQKAALFKLWVESQAEQNRLLMRKAGSFPSLYGSGIQPASRFQNEPNAGRYETIVTAPVVLERGWGDCAHLCAWRIAELREQGCNATSKVYWKPYGERLLFHVEVRLPDGSVEDPSRYLGM